MKTPQAKLPLLIITALLIYALPLMSQAQGFATVLSPFEGVQGGSDIVGAIRKIVNALLILVAIIAVIAIIFGSITAATSGTDDDRAARAKNNILFALLGLIIIGLSVVLVNFILSAVS